MLFSIVATFDRIGCKMDLIVDVQFCKDARGKNLVKEIAVVGLMDNYLAHYIVSPPYSVMKLSENLRKENNWLLQNLHGIAWTDGDVSQTKVKKNLSEILKSVGKIYVRGRDKVIFLQDLTIGEIINLEENDQCPSFEKLTWVNTYCLFHASKLCYLGLNCALNNAAKLKFWLQHCQDEQRGITPVPVTTAESHRGSFCERYDTANLGETGGFYLQCRSENSTRDPLVGDLCQ